jgi:hypothetical protein
LSLDAPIAWSSRGRTLALNGYSHDPADLETNITDTAIYLVRSVAAAT